MKLSVPTFYLPFLNIRQEIAALDQAGIENLKRLLEQESRPVLLVTHASSVDGTPLSDGMPPYHGMHTFYGMASGIISVERGRVYVQKK